MSFVKIIKAAAAVAGAGGTYAGVKKLPIPILAKAGLTLAGGGIGFFIGGKIVDGVIPGEAEETVKSIKSEKQKILQQNLKLPPDQQQLATISKPQMKMYANSLFTAMDGGGTKWTEVKAVIDKLQSDIDVMNLIEEFGTRSGTSMFASSTPDDLGTWFQDDGIKSDVNKILETKSMITYRF